MGLISEKQVGFFQNIEWVKPKKATWVFFWGWALSANPVIEINYFNALIEKLFCM